MRPVLFDVGPLTVYSYGLFVALGFGVGAMIVYRLAREAGLPTGRFVDYCLYAALAGLVGARLWYLAFRPDSVDSFWQVFSLGGGGLALPGALLGAGAVLIYALRRAREPIWRWLDVAVIGLAAGLAIGKLGSLLNGDGFGTASSVPWAVRMNDELSPAGATDGPVHPVQLYAAILYGLLAFGLWRSWSAQPRRDGRIFWLGLFGIGLVQLLVEPFHAGLDALAAGDFRVVVPVALAMMAASAVVLHRRYGGLR